MNLVSFQAFALLILVGLLIFFSSLISLDFHLAIDNKQHHKKGVFDRFFHFRGARSGSSGDSGGGVSAGSRTGSIKFSENGIQHNEVLEIDAEQVLREGREMEASEEQKQLLLKKLRTAESSRASQLREQERLAAYEQQQELDALRREKGANTAKDVSAPLTAFSSAESSNSSGAHDSVGDGSGCRLHFPAKCHINPLVKYWDEVTECYSSPLRPFVGRQAPLEERKFVVFQSDLGGWNNIRMALEVVVLIAQVRLLRGSHHIYKS